MLVYGLERMLAVDSSYRDGLSAKRAVAGGVLIVSVGGRRNGCLQPLLSEKTDMASPVGPALVLEGHVVILLRQAPSRGRCARFILGLKMPREEPRDLLSRQPTEPCSRTSSSNIRHLEGVSPLGLTRDVSE